MTETTKTPNQSVHGGGDEPLPCPFCGTAALEITKGCFTCGSIGKKLPEGYNCPGAGGGLLLSIWNQRSPFAPLTTKTPNPLKQARREKREARAIKRFIKDYRETNRVRMTDGRRVISDMLGLANVRVQVADQALAALKPSEVTK